MGLKAEYVTLVTILDVNAFTTILELELNK